MGTLPTTRLRYEESATRADTFEHLTLYGHVTPRGQSFRVAPEFTVQAAKEMRDGLRNAPIARVSD